MQPGAEPNQQGNVNLYFQADVRLPSSIVNERRRNKDIQIQAVCLATSDSNVCQNRMHWPDRMEVRVRSQTARVMSRNHKLGANGRDSATDLTPWLNRDATSLQVSVKAVGQENCFLFGVRAVVPRPLEVNTHTIHSVRYCMSGSTRLNDTLVAFPRWFLCAAGSYCNAGSS